MKPPNTSDTELILAAKKGNLVWSKSMDRKTIQQLNALADL
jgi:hypothetical protein